MQLRVARQQADSPLLGILSIAAAPSSQRQYYDLSEEFPGAHGSPNIYSFDGEHEFFGQLPRLDTTCTPLRSHSMARVVTVNDMHGHSWNVCFFSPHERGVLADVHTKEGGDMGNYQLPRGLVRN